MCDRCALIDYPIGDVIWLPCGGSPDRYTSRYRKGGGLPPITPNTQTADYDYDSQVKINDLMAVIRRQRSEISALKATHTQTDSRDSCEGIE